MPNIKECLQIIKYTPPRQALLFTGIHGIGKSEIVTNQLIEDDYNVKPLFVGQMADAGDLTGLPDREKNHVNVVHTVFRPQEWWPDDENEKFAILFDEINRGTPEIMQCIMDLVLNHTLMGKKLPKHSRIIGLMNPVLDDGFYMTNELDPAFLDRFKQYEFNPTHEEWLDWAMRNKLHPHIIGFVGKNRDMLDPIVDTKSGIRSTDIQPSRRAWKDLSDTLKSNEDIEYNDELIKIICSGAVGNTATSRFSMYLREKRKSFSANAVIMNWDSNIKSQLEKYELQDIIHMNRQVAFWFKEYEEILLIDDKMQVTAMKGLSKYLATIGHEPSSQFFNIMATDNNNKETYPKSMMKMNPDLAEGYFDTLHKKEQEQEQELEDNLGEPETPEGTNEPF